MDAFGAAQLAVMELEGAYVLEQQKIGCVAFICPSMNAHQHGHKSYLMKSCKFVPSPPLSIDSLIKPLLFSLSLVKLHFSIDSLIKLSFNLTFLIEI